MNLTKKRFIEYGLDADLSIILQNVKILEKEYLQLSRLQKKVKQTDSANWDELIGTSPESQKLYEECKSLAEGMNKAEYMKFIQDGSFEKLKQKHFNNEESKESV